MHGLVVIVPIPEGARENVHVAQALRELAPYIEAQIRTTEGVLIDKARPGVIKAAWQCRDDLQIPIPPEPEAEKTRR
jgi:hypothetical protein